MAELAVLETCMAELAGINDAEVQQLSSCVWLITVQLAERSQPPLARAGELWLKATTNFAVGWPIAVHITH